MSYELPMLPVVIPLGIIVFLVLLWVLRARHGLTLPRASVAAAMAVYASGIIANTVFPIFIHTASYGTPGRKPEAFTVYVTLFHDYGVDDAVENVIVFIPLAILVSLLLARPTWWRVLLIATSVSLAIELSQAVLERYANSGHLADINDWFYNTLGGVVGWGVLALATRHPGFAALVDRFRWPPRVSDPVRVRDEVSAA